MVRLALAAGDLERARNASAAVATVASPNEVPWMTGAALHCQGLIGQDAETLQAAASAYARVTSASARPGLRGSGHRLRAPRQLGARPPPARPGDRRLREPWRRTRSRAGRGIASQGGRQTRPPGCAPPAAVRLAQPHPDGALCAGLVAEGLSNPQIGERPYISRRTVQTHLAHVFAKLDISSRAQLAAEITRQRPGSLHL